MQAVLIFDGAMGTLALVFSDLILGILAEALLSIMDFLGDGHGSVLDDGF